LPILGCAREPDAANVAANAAAPFAATAEEQATLVDLETWDDLPRSFSTDVPAPAIDGPKLHDGYVVLPESKIPASDPSLRGVPAKFRALGLGRTATVEEMLALEQRVVATYKNYIIGCGATGDGRGFYSHDYEIRVFGYPEPFFIGFGHAQNRDGTVELIGVSAGKFVYRLKNGRFELRPVE
jgi:hypothetical protein